MSKSITCPKCGHEFEPDKKGNFTTLRVSRDFVTRLQKEQKDPTHEAVLRRLLGWEPLEEE